MAPGIMSSAPRNHVLLGPAVECWTLLLRLHGVVTAKCLRSGHRTPPGLPRSSKRTLLPCQTKTLLLP
jgi:hypothetical protein